MWAGYENLPTWRGMDPSLLLVALRCKREIGQRETKVFTNLWIHVSTSSPTSNRKVSRYTILIRNKVSHTPPWEIISAHAGMAKGALHSLA